MQKFRFTILAAITVIIVIGAVFLSKKPTNITAPESQTPNTNSVHTVDQKEAFAQPLNQTDKRVTKKPFGIFITPKNSPVQPEKFTGYHTGTDFETFPDEASTDVPFYAICEGKILQKRTATGYGGVLVQSCAINNQSVTVVYGHIKLSSISKNIGETLTQGEKIGLLGQPPTETDGERKHLHLGIHKGTDVNIKGYVQSFSELSGWLDFQKL